MKKAYKFAVAAAALAFLAPAFAQEEEVEYEGTVGWTPVAIGIATPVQLPWGLNRWDVYGLDLNLFYSDAPKMVGLDFALLAETTRKEAKGLMAGGLLNLALDNVYGARLGVGFNYCTADVYGLELGLIGARNNIYGADFELLGATQRNVTGFQFSGLANVSTERSYGATLAIGTNIAKTAYGLQLAAIFNMTDELHGCQIALVNYAKECPAGFQIGLVNIIRDNLWPVLPFVNGYF